MSPLLSAGLAWLGATILTVPILAAVVLVLAGPHSSLLPAPLQGAVLVLGWLGALVIPVAIARRVYRATQHTATRLHAERDV